jgi:hypothetical protein
MRHLLLVLIATAVCSAASAPIYYLEPGTLECYFNYSPAAPPCTPQLTTGRDDEFQGFHTLSGEAVAICHSTPPGMDAGISATMYMGATCTYPTEFRITEGKEWFYTIAEGVRVDAWIFDARTETQLSYGWDKEHCDGFTDYRGVIKICPAPPR